MILIVNKGCYGWEWRFVDFLIKTIFKIKIGDDFWKWVFKIGGVFKIKREFSKY